MVWELNLASFDRENESRSQLPIFVCQRDSWKARCIIWKDCRKKGVYEDQHAIDYQRLLKNQEQWLQVRKVRRPAVDLACHVWVDLPSSILGYSCWWSISLLSLGLKVMILTCTSRVSFWFLFGDMLYLRSLPAIQKNNFVVGNLETASQNWCKIGLVYYTVGGISPENFANLFDFDCDFVIAADSLRV